MSTPKLRRPPPTNNVELDRWNFELWRRLADTSLLTIAWSALSMIGSKLSDIETRLHSDLQSILGVTLTGSDMVRDKHVSDADAKRWEDGLASSSVAVSTGTFAGPTGTLVTFTERSSLNYILLVAATSSNGGHIGDVWFEPVSTSSARVHNSGLAGGTFRFKVMT